MSVVVDLLAGLVGAGDGRHRAPSRPRGHVLPTRWLDVGAAAVAAQLAALVAAAWVVGRLAVSFVTDALLVYVGVLLLPFLAAGLAGAVGAGAWLVGLARRLHGAEAAARADLAVAGAGGFVAGAVVALVAPGAVAAAMVLPAVADVVVALSPDAWRPAGDHPTAI